MSSRFITGALTAILGGFVVVVSQAFSPGVLSWVAFGNCRRGHRYSLSLPARPCPGRHPAAARCVLDNCERASSRVRLGRLRSDCHLVGVCLCCRLGRVSCSLACA